MTTALAPGLARKVKKVLETRTESPEMLGSLNTLSQFYGENTPTARQRLRATIEKQGLNINAQFLSAAESVIQALDVVQHDLDGLSASCGRISSALASSKAASAEMLGEVEGLARARAVSAQRSALVQQFLDQYQLSHDEVYALQEEEVGERFFAALERVREIHANCRALLRTHHQRAGLELMDSMALYQEAAYERLCRWVQGECRGLGDQDAPEVDPLLQRAARALRERAVLFKYCAEEVAAARHSALFQRFIAALTRGGPGGMPRPIEMHAHDPRRYIGDMLAWVHQSLASERELLVSLFGDDEAAQEAGVGEAASPRFAASGELSLGADMPATPLLLDRVFESICKPLKVRIEQVLVSGPPLLLCFKLSQLLGFYQDTVETLLGPRAQLTDTLRNCKAMAGRLFQEQLRARADKLLRYPPPPPKDLSPPPQVAEGMQQLAEIIETYEAAYEGSPEAGGAEFEAVLAATVDPLVEMCDRSSEALSANAPTRLDEGKHLAPSAQQVYLINCLAAVQGPLATHACTRSRAAQLGEAAEAQVARLVGGEVGTLLARCRLAEILERIRFYEAGKGGDDVAMAADPALSLERVSEAMRTFFNMLSNPDSLSEFENLQVPRVKADATARIAKSLADTYEVVYNIITDPQNGYVEDASTDAVKHTPSQVRTILGVVQ